MPADRTVRGALTALLARMDLDAAARGRLVEEIARYAAEEDPDRPVLALVAVDLDRFYTSLEATFEAVARWVDGDLPTGGGWHQELLERMGQPRDARPAVLTQNTTGYLLPLMRFRHFLRHAYAVDFDWLKLRPLARSLGTANNLLAADLAKFRRFVEDCLSHLGNP